MLDWELVLFLGKIAGAIAVGLAVGFALWRPGWEEEEGGGEEFACAREVFAERFKLVPLDPPADWDRDGWLS